MSSSALRALAVLDEIASADRPVGVTEISRNLSLPPASVFRSLDALCRCGLVMRYRESARYVPGPSAERLQRNLLERFPLRETCLPFLRQLASLSGDTVSLHVRTGWYAVRICSVPGTGEVTTVPPAGESRPLSLSCAGWAILAFLPRSETRAFQAWFREQRFGIGLPLSPGSGRIETEQIVARGFAGGQSETGEPVIAFPLRLNDRAVAAVTMSSDATENRDVLSACRDVIANLESLAASQPGLFANPFDHLNPDSIRLSVAPVALLRPESASRH